MQVEDGRFSLLYSQYMISHHVFCYFSAGRRKAGKAEMDLDNFSVVQTEMLLSRVDKVRSKHQDGDIIITAEIQVTYDQEGVEKARKDTHTAATTATPTPAPNPEPPLTAPSERGGRVREPVLTE